MFGDTLPKSTALLLLTAILVSLAHTAPATTSLGAAPAKITKAVVFEFASIGDSWASGVTYGFNGYTDYDKNDQNPPCMRTNHAYSVQLEKDWPVGNNLSPSKAHLNFDACSGARLADMVQGQRQLSHASPDTKLVLMQAGGNDAGFFRVATDCLFHQDQLKNYGEAYPGNGACSSTLNDVQDFIEAPIQNYGILKFTTDTIRDVLKDERAQKPDFKLYIIGYAHFFNVNDNWCSKSSFSVNVKELATDKRTPLTAPLRARINDLTERMNNKLKAAIAQVNSPKVVFIDVTRGFDGHRFCEDKHSILDQYFSDDVYFWNASPAHFFDTNGVVNLVSQTIMNAAYGEDYIYNKDPANASSYGWNWDDMFREDKNVHVQTPNQNGSPGLVLRPFHPTEGGHRVIKDAIKPQIAKDFPTN